MRGVVTGLLVLALAGAAHAQEPIDVKDPSITRRPAPNVGEGRLPLYPREAVRAGQEGKVTLSTCVNLAGVPYDVNLVKSSGHKVLDDAALGWLQKTARFNPAEASGRPVAVCNYIFTYDWQLPAAPPPSSPTDDYVDAADLSPDDLPVAISRPGPPAYPRGALARRASGKIDLSLCIGPDGTLKSVLILDADPDMELVSATAGWFGGSRYKPGQKDGKSVGVCGIEVSYDWKLPD